jgi:hypothetical protein
MNQYNDLRVIERSNLAAAQEAFLRSGGKIEPLESFTFEPRPKRIEPIIPQEELDRRAFVEQVREMGKTMSKVQIVQALGTTEHQVYQTCRTHGIICQSHRGKTPRSRTGGSGHGGIDIEADMRMVERIRALAEAGLRKSQVRAQVGLGWHVMERLVNTYCIAFPGPSQCE